MKSLVTVVFGALIWSGVAAADPCINSSSVRSWEAVDNQTLALETRQGVFLLDLGRCNQITRAEVIGFEMYGSRFLCSGDSILIMDEFNPTQVRGRCLIRGIEKQ